MSAAARKRIGEAKKKWWAGAEKLNQGQLGTPSVAPGDSFAFRDTILKMLEAEHIKYIN